MLSNELRSSIARHTEQIAEVLEPIAAEFTSISKSAEDAGNTTGNTGKTAITLAGEYGSLAKRMGVFIQEIKEGFAITDQSIFDMSDKIYWLMKLLDDFTFQINIFRLFSAVETARISEPKEIFMDIDKRLGVLLRKVLENHRTTSQLLDELMVLIRTEIKKDAIAQIHNAIELLRKVTSEGMVTTADTKGAALSLGENGHAFMRVATDMKKRVDSVKAVVETLKVFLGEAEKENIPNRKPVDIAFRRMETATFFTNINAFNAKIEVARCGGVEVLNNCANRILQYPQQLEEARLTCMELFNESVKLVSLMDKSKERRAAPVERQFQKAVEDVLFQGELLGNQMSIESERSKNEAFRTLSRKAEEALSVLVNSLCGEMVHDNDAIIVYRNSLVAISNEFQTEIINAGTHGAAHAVIRSEYDLFVKRISAFINEIAVRLTTE